MKSGFMIHTLLLVFLVSLQSYAQDHIQKPLKQYSLGNLRAIAVSPDEKYLATGGSGGAYLWDFNTGKILFYLTHEDVWTMDFSPDGALLLTGNVNGIITLYDTRTGTVKKKYSSPEVVFSVDFSPDGKSFLSCGWYIFGSSMFLIWNLETGENYEFYESYPSEARFTPSGTKILTAEYGKSELYDVETQTILQTFKRYHEGGNYYNINSVDISSDEKYAVIGIKGAAILYDAQTGEEIQIFDHDTPTFGSVIVREVCFSPDGKYLLTVSSNDLLTKWDISTGQIEFTKPHYSNDLCCTAFLPSSMRIIAGKSNGDIDVLDERKGDVIRTFKGHNEGIAASSLSLDQKLLLTGHFTSYAKLWDLNTGLVLTEFNDDNYESGYVALSPDGQYVLLCSCSEPKSAYMLDARTKEKLFTFPLSHYRGTVGFSKDGNYLLTGCSLRDYLGNLIHTFEGECAFFTPDSAKILTFDDDDEAILWDIESKKPIHTMDIPSRFSYPPPVFSRDSKLLFFCTGMMDDSHDSQLWDLTKGTKIRDISAGYTESAAFSAGARYLVIEDGIWSNKHKISFLDINSMRAKSSFCAHKGPASSIYFLNDRRILSTGEDGTIRFWDVPSFLSTVTDYQYYR